MAGIAAALAAARAGCKTILIERGNHFGGMTASGLGSIDTLRENAFGGIFNEFLVRVREYYFATYGKNSEQYRLTYNGFFMEPHVAETILDGMLEAQKGLKIFKKLELVEVVKDGNSVVASVYRNRNTDERVDIQHAVAIDGTYEGDLAAAAGVAFRIGREGREAFGERFAGVIFHDWRGHRQEILPESTGEPSDHPQANCFRLTLSDDPLRRIPFSKPATFQECLPEYKLLQGDIERGRVRFLREILWLNPLPNRKVCLNGHIEALTSANLAELSADWISGSWEKREALFAQYKQYTEGLLYFLQNELAIPKALREEAGCLGLSPEEYPTDNHFPWQLYVRQGRRIKGEVVLTEHDSVPEAGRQRPHIHKDTIAICEHSFDTHPCRQRTSPGAIAKTADGFELIEGVIHFRNRFKAPNRPATIPYRAIVPENVDGLLVPAALSATNVAFSAVRMEPAWMAIGQAAGLAAAQALSQNQKVRQVDVSELQVRLLKQRQVLVYFNDLTLEDPDFERIQLKAIAEDYDSFECRELKAAL